jgi:PAS domain S-box-containing protein
MNKPIQHINDIGLLAVDSIGVPLAYWDKDQICRFANNALEEWFGKSREELVDKKTLKDLLGPLYEKNLPYIIEALKGTKQQFEREIKTPSGDIRYTIVNYYPDCYEGTVRGFTVHLVDITEQKKAQEALHLSEEKYRSLVNLSPAGITLSTMEGKPLEVNQAVLDIYGYEFKEEFLNTSIWEHYVDPNDRKHFIELVKKEGVVKNFEVRQIRKNGEIIWISNDVQTFKLPDGELAILKHSTDITVSKKADEALHFSEEKFRSLVNLSPTAISLSTMEGKVLEINQAILDIFGFESKEEFINMPALDHYSDKNDRTQLIELFKKEGIVKNYEIQLIKKNGVSVWVSVYLMPFLMPDGEMALLSTFLDITDFKKVVEQIQDVNKELEAFTYSVSHDLRAPLRAVNGYSQMLSEEYGTKLDAEGKRIIETICNNAVNMGKLIDELLAFSKLGRKEVLRTKINMNELVKGVIEEMDKSLTNKAEIKISKLHNLNADYTMIRQVMFNLIANALKYSSKKEHPIIELFSEEKQGQIVFSVKDNGAGFDMNYYDKLFGVFQRLHKQSEFEGIGVGLAIVYRVITKHGGKVWAEGKVNEGAVFKFSLLTNQNQ